MRRLNRSLWASLFRQVLLLRAPFPVAVVSSSHNASMPGFQSKYRHCNIYYLLVCTKCTRGTTVSRLACLASFASIYRPVLTFWQSDLKCRLKGLDLGPELMALELSPIGADPTAIPQERVQQLVIMEESKLDMRNSMPVVKEAIIALYHLIGLAPRSVSKFCTCVKT